MAKERPWWYAEQLKRQREKRALNPEMEHFRSYNRRRAAAGLGPVTLAAFRKYIEKAPRDKLGRVNWMALPKAQRPKPYMVSRSAKKKSSKKSSKKSKVLARGSGGRAVKRIGKKRSAPSGKKSAKRRADS